MFMNEMENRFVCLWIENMTFLTVKSLQMRVSSNLCLSYGYKLKISHLTCYVLSYL